jgi:hypothetical protein
MICAKAERGLDSQGITQEYKSRDIKKSRWGKYRRSDPSYILHNPRIPVLGSLSNQSELSADKRHEAVRYEITHHKTRHMIQGKHTKIKRDDR